MWKTLAKAAVSVLLIWLLLRGQDLGALSRQILTMDRTAFILAALALWLLAVPSSFRWTAVLAAMGHQFRVVTAFRIVLIGLFFNLTLPSSVGGDAVRIWEANRSGLSVGTAIVSVMIDRLVALMAVLLLVLATTPFSLELIPDQTARTGIVALLGLGFTGFAVAMALDRLPASLRRFRAVRAIAQLSAALRRVMLIPKHAVPTLIFSLVNQGGIIVVVAILANGLGFHVEFVQCAIIVPLTILATVVPISIAGWGVRESAFVVGFGFLGVPAASALALSVIFGVTNTIISLPGGLLWLKSGARRNPSRIDPTEVPSATAPQESFNDR